MTARHLGAAALFGLSLALVPRAARANFSIDAAYVSPLAGHASNGWTVGFRAGEELHAPLLQLTPEVGASYSSFGGKQQILTGTGGLRLAIGELVRPGGYAHVGWGYAIPDFGMSQLGLKYDVGAFLDFTLSPLVNIGVDYGYNRLLPSNRGDESLKWTTFGGHLDFVF